MGRDADTGVGDTQHGATVTQRLPADADLAALRGVTHRVADQIGERAVQFLGGTGQIAACIIDQLDLMATTAQGLCLPFARSQQRSEVRRVGQEGVRTWWSGVSPYT